MKTTCGHSDTFGPVARAGLDAPLRLAAHACFSSAATRAIRAAFAQHAARWIPPLLLPATCHRAHFHCRICHYRITGAFCACFQRAPYRASPATTAANACRPASTEPHARQPRLATAPAACTARCCCICRGHRAAFLRALALFHAPPHLHATLRTAHATGLILVGPARGLQHPAPHYPPFRTLFGRPYNSLLLLLFACLLPWRALLPVPSSALRCHPYHTLRCRYTTYAAFAPFRAATRPAASTTQLRSRTVPARSEHLSLPTLPPLCRRLPLNSATHRATLPPPRCNRAAQHTAP